MKKRILTILLCLVMALSLLPTAVFAVNAQSPITKVTVTVAQMPTVGRSTDVSGITITTEPADAFNVEYMHWYNTSDSTLDDTTFQEGKTYCLELRLSPKDGYYFQFDPTNNDYLGEATCNGEAPYDASRSNGTENLFIRFQPAAAITVTSYTVSFEMNGHGTQVEAQTVDSGDKVTKPADPTEKGYRFGGWYVDEKCRTKFDFDTAITADTTLYAKWTKISSDSATPADTASPKTADSSNMLLWMMLAVMSGAALCGAAAVGEKRKCN